MTNKEGKINSNDYQQFVSEIVSLVQKHRAIAVQAVQTFSNQLYWSIGELIIKKQQEYGWGKSIVEKLSSDLTLHIGEGVSWSPRNLRFMRQMVEEYSNLNQVGSDNLNIKQPDDKPSIGILLVPNKDHLEVEYALRTASKPIGVAQYTLSKKLLDELLGKLPSAEDFQQILTNNSAKK